MARVGEARVYRRRAPASAGTALAMGRDHRLHGRVHVGCSRQPTRDGDAHQPSAAPIRRAHPADALRLDALDDTIRVRVVAEAHDAQEALEVTLRYQPDIVVMDIRLPGKNGIEATRDILAARPATKVIMLTSHADDEVLFEAIGAGASGYVLKQIGSDDLVRALETVGRGESTSPYPRTNTW